MEGLGPVKSQQPPLHYGKVLIPVDVCLEDKKIDFRVYGSSS